MMDHVRQRDWCSARINHNQFVEEQDIDNCVVERIIRNKFWDPLISSDEDEPLGPIDWDSIFNKKSNKQQQFRHFIPGHRKPPPYPKLSALTQIEHLKGIKVLCAQNQHILCKEFLGRPVKNDFRVFEEKKTIYELEQKEYIEWAKHLWQTSNCIRALRPKPLVEMVYDAEFKMKAHMLQSFPKRYTMAAQIPLWAENHSCEMILPRTDLVKVDVSKLPKVCFPKIYENKESILRESSVPKPCNQHPCKFKLPYEAEPSVLPLTELHKELAQYALDNGAGFVASENAIKCLLETDRCWSLPLSVCNVIGPDGDMVNIVVLGDEFPDRREAATTRSYRAFTHLLLNAFTDKSSKPRVIRPNNDSHSNEHSSQLNTNAQKKSNIEKKPRNNRNVVNSRRPAVAYNSAVRRMADRNDSDDSDDEMRLEIDLNDDAMHENQNASEIVDDHKKDLETQPRKILKARPRKSVEKNNSQITQQSNKMYCQTDLVESDDEALVIDMGLSDSVDKSDQGSRTMDSHDSSKINSHDSSKMDSHDSSKLDSQDSSKMDSHDSSNMDSQDSSKIDSHILSKMDSNDSSKLDSHDTSNMDSQDSSKMDSHDSSKMDSHDLSKTDSPNSSGMVSQEVKNKPNGQDQIGIDELLKCVCKGSEFETPFPRSYKKVQIKNNNTKDYVNVIIHSSHKLRKDWCIGEVILEPILEYQLDIGGTSQSPQKIQSLAFSLMLRKNADLVIVRVDGSCGELVSIETTELRELCARHAHCSAAAVANTVYTTLNQLAGLLPGHYLLRHEPCHGANALLYSRAETGAAAAGAVPLQSTEPLSPAEEARLVSAPPALAPVLLPYHKFHRLLPLAFTHNPKLVAKENSKKVINKPKLPPAAIQWPKKKGRRKKGKK